MLTDSQLIQIKEAALMELPSLVSPFRDTLNVTDTRLTEYIDSICCDGGATHNIFEVLGVVKFCRLLGQYTWRQKEVQRFIRLYESLKFNGLKGRQCYKLTPIQVFQFANIYGFARKDGTRLVRQAILFVPRKFGKTTAVAALALDDMLFGDANAQCYMAANSESQSGICFKEAKALVRQLDPDEKQFRITASEINWRLPNKYGKESSITRLTAGGRTKDGLAASLVIYDEYAGARYVKDHSDGAELLQVLTSSMGIRRQPLTVIITTANRVIDGPFEVMLRSAQDTLIGEVDGTAEEADWQFASIFQPDPWELADDTIIGKPATWRKCNPHIGVTIQPEFYNEEYSQAVKDPEKMKEFCCKYLNIFQSDKVKDWLSADDIRRLQTDISIDTLPSITADGRQRQWVVFAGMDFSDGDDFCGMSYLAYDMTTDEFFADCDAWISEQTLARHSNSTLYQRWIDGGYLRVCPGAVIDEHMVTARIEQLSDKVNIIRIGYDTYDAKRFLNDIKAMIYSQNVDPDNIVRPVRQSNAQYNSPVQELEYMVRSNPPLIHFSSSPLYPWEFSNAVLDIDRMENKRPVKRTANAKVDNVQCLLSAIVLFDEVDGSINK